MKFLADVNIPQSIVIYLNNLGHDILDIKKHKLAAKDVEIIKIAQKEKRIILTLDKDFIALTQFPKYQIATIVIRLKNLKSSNILEHLIPLISNQDKKILSKSLTIVKEESADSHPYS